MINKKLLLIVILLPCGLVHAVTLVYNMRIAAPPSAREELYKKLGARLPAIIAMSYVNQLRKTRGGNTQKVNAGLVDYIYSWDKWYMRIDGALGNTHDCAPQTGRKTSHTQADDILFSTGYRHTGFHEKISLAYSALAGIPTHRDHGFEYFQFGTGHFSVGAQIDGIYTIGASGTNSLIMALRFLHFFKANTWVPLPIRPLCVSLEPGNVFDIFIAYHKRLNKHSFEVGYNPAFAFGIHTTPALEDIPSSGSRNNWYAAYRYIFIAKKHPMGFSLGISYGFDSGKTDIGLKRVVSTWGAYGINF